MAALAYAARPDLASREQQIAVAPHLAARRCLASWPHCGACAGGRPAAGHHTVPAPRPAQRPAAQRPDASDSDAAATDPDDAIGLAPDAGTVVVQDGDTLAGIAQAQQAAGGLPNLDDANHDTIGDNPDLVLPGHSLRLP
ncbi:transglycosylase family protein [Kitasatospora sp. NPDC059571]|uniref:transglycosylase family protein n=1 Tax=Kitasatospora sp. NPDC059571 TaxID=3346871 RepID=UPI0036B8477B